MQIRHGVFIVLLLSVLTPQTLQGQGSSSFLFRVKGPTGPITLAEVRLFVGDQPFLTGWTDEEGNLRMGPIPAGSYKVEVEAFGYRMEIREDVRLGSGGFRTLEFLLEVTPVEMEGIIVQGERLQIERETVEFATEIAEEAMSLLPVSREARELVALTPGARPDHVWGGASAQANSYRIDGLSMNHPGLGSDLFQPSPNWIESIEIRGLGAGAEYGGFQGGLVDVTTKRGTNRVQGLFRSNLEHDGLTGSNLVKTEIGTEVVRRFDMEGEIRGPLIRNQLFYYLSGQRVVQDSRALNHLPQLEGKHTPFNEERTEGRALAKLTWTPSDEDLLELSVAYSDTRADNYHLTGYELDGATYRHESPAWLVNGTARKVFGRKVQLEARINHLSLDERSDSYQGPTVPAVTHYTPMPPHYAFGNAPLRLRSAPASTAASAMGTFRVEMGGYEHSVKVGGEYTQGSYQDERIRNGGMTWIPAQVPSFDPADPGTWKGNVGEGIPSLWGGEVRSEADVANAALFVQSAIALGSRVIVSPGVRWNQWKGWITPSSGSRFLAVQDQALDPRLGISVDLTGDETLVLKAHWGRYHQSLISQMFDRVGGADVFTNEEFWNYTGPPFSDPLTTFTTAQRDSLAALGFFTKAGEAVLNETGRVKEYRQPYVQQWLVGLEKKMGNSAKIEFLYSRRSNRDMVALVDLNRGTNYSRFDRVHPLNSEGYYIVHDLNGVVFEEFYLPNDVVLERLRCLANGSCPGAATIPGLSPADTLGLSWDPDYALTTAPGAKREFSQIQVNLELARPTWGGSISYVRTHLEGNLDNVSGYTDPLGFGPGPYVRVNEGVSSYGTLGNFSEWEMKASLWGQLPLGLRGGLFWTFRAGDHYSSRFRLSGMGVNRYWIGPKGSTPQYLPVFGELDYRLVEPLEGHTVFVGQRGLKELERQSITDLRVEKSFRIGGYRMAATLDVFNLFRCEAIAQKNNLVNHSPFDWRLDPEEGWGGVEPNERYGVPLDRVKPQTIRLGLVTYF
jgi:hypothetical protein